MDPKELKQEIEKNATHLLSSPGTGGTSNLQALMALHQLEQDKERDEQLEGFMPKMLEALKGMPSDSRDVIGDLRNHNLQLQEHLGQAQNDLRLLAKDVTKYAAELIGEKASGMSDARFETLASQDDVYDLEETLAAVDWRAVHDLRIRAPRHLEFREGHANREGWRGTWLYIDSAGEFMTDDCNVTALGYLNEETAAVYRVGDDGDEPSGELYWERRFLYTAQMTKGRQEDLKREMRKREKENL